MLIAVKLLAGIVLMAFGGEILVRGATRLSYGLGLPPLVVGLTVVAMGTSAPEFMIAFQSSLSGHMAVSFGDVVGSNVFNVFFILGLCALIRSFSATSIRHDLLVMVGCVGLFYLLCLDLKLQTWNGMLLVAVAIFYTIFRFFHASSHREVVQEAQENRLSLRNQYRKPGQMILNGLFLALGIACLSFGSQVLLGSAVTLARTWNMSEYFIGLAMVAVGTSLPELVTCIVAVLRQREEMAVGNIIGSNIYNLCLVLGGVTSLGAGAEVKVPGQIVKFDLPFMFGAFALWLLFSKRLPVMNRRTGAAFLAVYVFYLSQQH